MSRYIFVVNYAQKKRNGDIVNQESVVERGSINNQWFLMADYVIDTKMKTVLKNRKQILTNEQLIKAYSSL